MNKKISVGMMVTIVILAMTVTFSITMLLAMRLFDSTVSSVKEKENMYSKISELDRYVRSNDYYNIDETTLYDMISSGYILGTGDRYARYYTADAYAELLNVQNGTLIGIGVELSRAQTGYARVLKVYDDSPAQDAGITVGCYITAVDGVDLKTLPNVDAIQSRLRGETGTTVSVTWLNADAVEQSAELIRSGYTTTTVDYQMTAESVGYIKIRQFDATTPSELDYAIRSLSSAGADSLIFDLRDNAGGILEEAMRCIDLICPEGTLAWAEDKNGNREVLGSSSNDTVVDLPIVCIVNGNTASAAELFASCLRNMNGALLVGSNTQGKGTIQSSPQRLSDGSAVVVTVAKLISCDGESFDGAGLTVDVERPLTSDEEGAFYDFTVETDPQILRAVSTAQYLSGNSTLGAAAENETANNEEDNASGEEEVTAEAAGTITSVTEENGLYTVVLTVGDDVENAQLISYAELTSVTVAAEEEIAAGDTIGYRQSSADNLEEAAEEADGEDGDSSSEAA